MEKDIPGVQDAYDQLSAFAHPNWSDVFGLFAIHDQLDIITQFGRDVAERSLAKEIACDFLAASLAVFDGDGLWIKIRLL
jgi:hypothetical protein